MIKVDAIITVIDYQKVAYAVLSVIKTHNSEGGDYSYN